MGVVHTGVGAEHYAVRVHGDFDRSAKGNDIIVTVWYFAPPPDFIGKVRLQIYLYVVIDPLLDRVETFRDNNLVNYHGALLRYRDRVGQGKLKIFI